ncbi:MAG: T9SS type A sorting domain-containing protein, partial [Bacteroidetes bacterium]|nr:T9SS type A sorting domain-containing protein [Bacteroidota bacterium]
ANSSGTSIANGNGQPEFAIALSTLPSGGTVTAQNFGIEQLPIAQSLSTKISNPATGSIIIMNGGNNPPVLQGSDPEDQPATNVLTGKTVSVTSIPTNAILYYNGIAVTPDQTITNFNPSLFYIQTNSSTQLSTSVVFQYNYIDAAGLAGTTPATYTLFWQGILPVRLLDFSATVQQQCAGIQLSWITENEQNVQQYTVERSIDGVNWKKTGTVTTLKTVERHTYNFTDNPDQNGIYYYRLIEQDIDDSETICSTVVYARMNCLQEQYAIYPNPAHDIVLLKGWNNISAVEVIDISGKIVYKKQIGRCANPEPVNLPKNLPAGIYIIEVSGFNNDSKRFRLLKF